MKRMLTVAQQNELCEAVTNGATLELAAAMIGCTENIIRNTAEADLEFRRRLAIAESEMTERHFNNLWEAVRDNGDPQAAFRLLEFLEAQRDPVEEFLNGVIDLSHDVRPRLDKATRKKIGRQIDKMIDELIPDEFHRPWRSFIPKQR
jgi:hypothetical protein